VRVISQIWKLRAVRQIEEVPRSHWEPFSRRTPLNFFATVVFLAVFFFAAAAFFGAAFLAFLIAMNSPDGLSRLVQVVAPPIVVLVWLRFFTAPLRALSPVGLFVAIPGLLILHRGGKNSIQTNRFQNESDGLALSRLSVA